MSGQAGAHGLSLAGWVSPAGMDVCWALSSTTARGSQVLPNIRSTRRTSLEGGLCLCRSLHSPCSGLIDPFHSMTGASPPSQCHVMSATKTFCCWVCLLQCSCQLCPLQRDVCTIFPAPFSCRGSIQGYISLPCFCFPCKISPFVSLSSPRLIFKPKGLLLTHC